jgi:hypothetical protein
MPNRESDQQYFSRRYDEECASAEAAANQEARIAHLELAARYAQFAAAIREVEERLGGGSATAHQITGDRREGLPQAVASGSPLAAGN